MKSGRLNAWRQSTQWRMISREAIKRWNAKRETLPKCGARRKRDGASCMQLAKENGRCHYHGGSTPKAEQWMLVQWPNGKRPDVEAKLQAKLKRIERTRKEKAKRRSRMTADELAAHERWHQTHQAGARAGRARKRRDRQQAEEFRQRIANDEPRPVSDEIKALQAQAAALEEARDYFRRLAEQEQANQDQGVFG